MRHTALLAALTRYLDSTPLPPSFARIVARWREITIVTQSDSVILAALLNSFARRSQLPGVRYVTPDAPLDDALTWVSIHDEAALEYLRTRHPQRQLVTLSLFHVRGPLRSNPRNHLSIPRLLSILAGARFMFIIFGEPLVARHPHAGPHTGVKHLVRRLKVDFYRNMKVIRGTPFQSFDTQAQLTLTGVDFERELAILAQRAGEPVARTRKRAFLEFHQIAANPRRPLYGLGAPVVRFMLRRLFREIRPVGLDALVPAVRDHTVVLVPMHRSHLDYLILGSTLYDANLNPPLVAAGINLAFWPVGPLIRSLGAYFVRRNARHNRIHGLVLRRYVTYLVKRGHLQEFFIEGGRSRTGKMRQPKTGILNIMIDAWTKRMRRDILFVPISLTYENVIEDSTYGDENTGKSKVKENFISLLRARKVFRHTYGEVILHFGEPISLAKFLESESERHGPPDRKQLGRALGVTLVQRIRAQSHLSLTNLTYSALLMAPRYGLKRSELVQRVRDLAELAFAVSSTPKLSPTPALEHFLNGREGLLNDLLRGGIVGSANVLEDQVVYIPGRKRFTADFYRNSAIHVFFNTALLALSQLMSGTINLVDATKFHPRLAYDFILPELPEFATDLTRTLHDLHLHGYVRSGPNGLEFDRSASPAFIPSLLWGTVQSYLWVLEHLTRSPLNEPCAYQPFLAQLLDSFRAAGYVGAVTRTEAGSHSALTTVLESLQQRKLIVVSERNGKPETITVRASLREDLELFAAADQALIEHANTQASR